MQSGCEGNALLIYCVVCDRKSCRTVFVLCKSILILLIVPHRIHKKSIIMKTSCLDYSILPKANGLTKLFCFKKRTVSLPRSMNNELFTRAKTFHRLYTAVDQGSRDGAVVRALASHSCGPRSILGPGVTCGLSLLLVLVPAPRVFLRGFFVQYLAILNKFCLAGLLKFFFCIGAD